MYCGSSPPASVFVFSARGLLGNRSFTSSRDVVAVVPEIASTSERARTDVGANVIVDVMTAMNAIDARTRRARALVVRCRLSTSSEGAQRAARFPTSDARRISADNRCLLNWLVSTFLPFVVVSLDEPPHRRDPEQTTDTRSDEKTHDRPATRSWAWRLRPTHESKVHATFTKGAFDSFGSPQVTRQKSTISPFTRAQSPRSTRPAHMSTDIDAQLGAIQPSSNTIESSCGSPRAQRRATTYAGGTPTLYHVFRVQGRS